MGPVGDDKSYRLLALSVLCSVKFFMGCLVRSHSQIRARLVVHSPLFLQMFVSRLYKSLGDYDVLHGVFSRQIGTKPITREALEAEERRDYFEALRLYKEVSSCL